MSSDNDCPKKRPSQKRKRRRNNKGHAGSRKPERTRKNTVAASGITKGGTDDMLSTVGGKRVVVAARVLGGQEGEARPDPDKVFASVEKRRKKDVESVFFKRFLWDNPDAWWPEFETNNPDLVKAMQKSVHNCVKARFVAVYRAVDACRVRLSDDAVTKLYDDTVKSVQARYATRDERRAKGYDLWDSEFTEEYLQEPLFKAIKAIKNKGY